MEEEYSPAVLLDKLDRVHDREQHRALCGLPLREMPLVFV